MQLKKHVILLTKKGCGFMMTASTDTIVRTTDSAKKELYRLLAEGYQAMQDGQICTIEEVKDAITKRRLERG